MNGFSVCGSCAQPMRSTFLPPSWAEAGAAAATANANAIASATSALTLMVILSR